jgi:hypothetical protein
VERDFVVRQIGKSGDVICRERGESFRQIKTAIRGETGVKRPAQINGGRLAIRTMETQGHGR